MVFSYFLQSISVAILFTLLFAVLALSPHAEEDVFEWKFWSCPF